MSDRLREPWARRGEMWDRAEHAADGASADQHPEMLALIATQHHEIVALMAVHAQERIRLGLELRGRPVNSPVETADPLGRSAAAAMDAESYDEPTREESRVEKFARIRQRGEAGDADIAFLLDELNQAIEAMADAMGRPQRADNPTT